MTVPSGSGGKWWFNGLPFTTVEPTSGTILGGQKYWFNGLPMSAYSEVVVLDQSLVPSLVVDTDTFYTHVIGIPGIPSDVTLTASLVTDTDVFYTPTVSTGAATLSPSLVIDTDTFYAPVLTTLWALTPGIVTDTDTFFAPAVTKYGTLLPALCDDTDIFRVPAVVPGSVSRQADLVVDEDIIYQVSTVQFNQLQLSLLVDIDTFYSVVISTNNILLPDLVDEESVIVPPGSEAPWFVNAPYINEDTVFYSLSVSIYNNVSPSFVNSSEIFYTSIFVPGPVTIRPSRVIDLDIFLTAFVGIIDNTPNPIGGDPSNLPGNLKYVSAITMTQSGLILSLETRINAAKIVNTRMVIYDNSATGGMPGALLGSTFDKTTTVSGANLYTLRVPVSVLAGQVVWVGIHSDGGFQWLLVNSKNGSKYNTDTWAGGASDPFGPTSNDNKKAPIVVYYLQSANASMTAGLVVDTDVIYPPSRSSSNNITAPYMIDTDFFYPWAVSNYYPLLPEVYTDDDIIYAANVAAGAVMLAPPFIADDAVFYSPSVERFALQISNVFSAVVPNDDTFYSPVVSMNITLTAALVVDTDVFYGTVVNRIGVGISNVFSAAMPSDDNIYVAAVRLASVPLSTTLVVDSDTIYSPIVERFAPLIDTIFSASMPSTDVIYQTTVSLLGANLPPLLVLDVDVIHSPSILSRYILLTGTPPSAPDFFYAPSVTEGVVTLAPTMISSGLDIYAAAVSTELDNRTLSPSRVQHDDRFYQPLSEGGSGGGSTGNVGWRRQVYLEGEEARIEIDGVIPTPEPVE
jgi:hypothetical protein